MSEQIERLPYGWFDKAEDVEPAYNPPLICLVCMEKITEEECNGNIQTISLTALDMTGKSYFFRVHKTCWEALSELEKTNYESGFIDKEKEVPSNE